MHMATPCKEILDLNPIVYELAVRYNYTDAQQRSIIKVIRYVFFFSNLLLLLLVFF